MKTAEDQKQLQFVETVTGETKSENREEHEPEKHN